jgi:5-formyltetrahydrofolate cyclo-ligase
MSLTSISTHAEIRRSCRRNRRSLSATEQASHSLALLDRLRDCGLLLRDRHMGAYLAADGELDLLPLQGLLQRRGIELFLPVLRAYPPGTLWFVRHAPGDPLLPNRFGIPEPRYRHHRACLPWTLDTLLMPLVAFDSQCHRMGMGGGYYDRTLAYLRHRQQWRRPRLVGVAHECQRVEFLPTRPWDVPLDMVVTEARVYRATPGQRGT